MVQHIRAYLVLGAADHLIKAIVHDFASTELGALVDGDGCVSLLEFLAAV